MTKTVPAPTPYGYTLFCDDIRQEINGKVSLIGVYGGDLIVAGPLPVALAKLALRITYIEQPGESTEPVEIHIYLPGNPDGQPIQRIPLPVDFRSMAPDPHPGLTDPLLIAVFNMEFSPLPLQQEGQIKVRAYRGDLEIRLGTLLVHARQAPPAASAAT